MATTYTYIARVTAHINEDLARNWSAWNFGEGGIKATADKMESMVEAALESDDVLEISYMPLMGSGLRRAWQNGEIRELYSGYWVLEDTENGWCGGIACNILPVSSEAEAIAYVNAPDFRMEMGAGDFVDCTEGQIVAELPYDAAKKLYIVAVPVID